MNGDSSSAPTAPPPAGRPAGVTPRAPRFGEGGLPAARARVLEFAAGGSLVGRDHEQAVPACRRREARISGTTRRRKRFRRGGPGRRLPARTAWGRRRGRDRGRCRRGSASWRGRARSALSAAIPVSSARTRRRRSATGSRRTGCGRWRTVPRRGAARAGRGGPRRRGRGIGLAEGRVRARGYRSGPFGDAFQVGPPAQVAALRARPAASACEAGYTQPSPSTCPSEPAVAGSTGV